MTSKQEILNNLDKWTLQNSGRFVAFDDFWGSKEINLNSKEEKEVRNAIIEKVKQNPGEWRIEKINVEYRTGPYPYLDEMGKYFWDCFLVHQSAQIEMIKKGRKEEIIKWIDYGKMHYQRGFSEKEWQELEKLPLGNKEAHANIQHDNQKNNNSNKGNLWIVFLATIIILGAVVWIGIKKLITN